MLSMYQTYHSDLIYASNLQDLPDSREYWSFKLYLRCQTMFEIWLPGLKEVWWKHLSRFKGTWVGQRANAMGNICCFCCRVAKSCPTLCNPVDCCMPGSSVHGISQARILVWVAISFFRGSSQIRDQTWVSCDSCIGRWILYHWANWEALGQVHEFISSLQP